MNITYVVAPTAWAARSIGKLVRRIVLAWKSGCGICPTPGCWNDDNGHTGCCTACWYGQLPDTKADDGGTAQ